MAARSSSPTPWVPLRWGMFPMPMYSTLTASLRVHGRRRLLLVCMYWGWWPPLLLCIIERVSANANARSIWDSLFVSLPPPSSPPRSHNLCCLSPPLILPLSTRPNPPRPSSTGPRAASGPPTTRGNSSRNCSRFCPHPLGVRIWTPQPPPSEPSCRPRTQTRLPTTSCAI